jgi:hypothetical protein
VLLLAVVLGRDVGCGEGIGASEEGGNVMEVEWTSRWTVIFYPRWRWGGGECVI